jgi:hypothetical protein
MKNVSGEERRGENMFKKDLLAPMYAHTFQRAKRENLEGVSL